MEIDFSTFLVSLASSAYCSLGVIPNPVTQKTEKNLISAKQQIELMEMLKEKTKGNLTDEEDKLMESILCQLHMTYVKCVETKEEEKPKEEAEKKAKAEGKKEEEKKD